MRQIVPSPEHESGLQKLRDDSLVPSNFIMTSSRFLSCPYASGHIKALGGPESRSRSKDTAAHENRRNDWIKSSQLESKQASTMPQMYIKCTNDI